MREKTSWLAAGLRWLRRARARPPAMAVGVEEFIASGVAWVAPGTGSTVADLLAELRATGPRADRARARLAAHGPGERTNLRLVGELTPTDLDRIAACAVGGGEAHDGRR